MLEVGRKQLFSARSPSRPRLGAGLLTSQSIILLAILYCEIYEPSISLPRGRGGFSIYPALRDTFQPRKYEQAKAANYASLPFIGIMESVFSSF